MSRRLGLRLGAIVLVVVAGFGAWWVTHGAVVAVTGLHQVDGFWLGPEASCAPPDAPDECGPAVQTATRALAARDPGAVVVGAAIASPSCSSANFVVCTTAGLEHGVFAVLDLRDGSRQVVGLMCSGTATQGSQVVSLPDCQPADLSNLEPGGPSGGP